MAESEKSGQLMVKVEALSALGFCYASLLDFDKAHDNLQIMRAIADPEDAMQQLILLRAESGIAHTQGRYPAARAAAEKGLQLARSSGNRFYEGRFYNMLHITTNDLAMKGVYLEQSLQCAEEVGALGLQNTVLMNSSGWWMICGLYEHAIENAQRALQNSRSKASDNGIMFSLQFLGQALIEQGKFDEAEIYLEEALQVTHKTKNLWLEASIRALQAFNQLYQDCPQDALAGLQEFSEQLEKMPGLVQAGLIALQAFATRQTGDMLEARNLAKQALGLIREEDFGNIDILPDEVLWWCYRTLAPDAEQTPLKFPKNSGRCWKWAAGR